jgi:exopolysaccharide biosynthesis polyprenyl glycosylphosphotransferase
MPFPQTRTTAGMRATAALDVALLTTALALASADRSFRWPQTAADVLTLSISVGQVLQLAVFAALSIAVFRAAGLYDRTHVRHGITEAVRVTIAIAVIGLVAGRGALFTFWIVGSCAVCIARTLRARASRASTRCRRALIVGSGPHAMRVCRELSGHSSIRYRVVGFVDTVQDNSVERSRFVTRRTFGTLDQLESILVREHVDEVHIGLPIRSHYLQIQETIRVCERVGVKLMYRADVFETVLAKPELDPVSPRVALRVVAEGFSIAIKRSIDLAGAVTLLVVLSPLLLITAIAVAVTSPGPVIFSQQRYGLNRRRFRMLKFRTMVQNADGLQAALESKNEAHGPVFKIARDPRITPLGRILRRTSIDELPQLINVIKGDMSLVGPRPLPLRDVTRFTRTSDMRRFSVRPGLTGLWQVSGRSTLDFEAWVRLDLHYIDRWSLRLDFDILARTIPAVIRGTGAA